MAGKPGDVTEVTVSDMECGYPRPILSQQKLLTVLRVLQ